MTDPIIPPDDPTGPEPVPSPGRPQPVPDPGKPQPAPDPGEPQPVPEPGPTSEHDAGNEDMIVVLPSPFSVGLVETGQS